jgi:hypothetical protein
MRIRGSRTYKAVILLHALMSIYVCGIAFAFDSQNAFKYVVSFEASGEFHPLGPRDLFDVFSELRLMGKFGHFWVKPEDGKLVAHICTDLPDTIQKALAAEPRLEYIESIPMTTALREECKSYEQESFSVQPQQFYCSAAELWKESLRRPEEPRHPSTGCAYTHVVTFEPTDGFHPKTPREILEVLDRANKLTRTGYFRTKAQDGKLVGRICTDDPDALQRELATEPRLKWIEAVRLDQRLFREHAASKQDSLPQSSP